MIREVAQIGNAVLRTIAKEITSDEVIHQLAEDLNDTLLMQSAGVAIAAPQIFEEYRAFLINIKANENRPEVEPFGPLVMINPVIEKEFGEKAKIYEACLSIPGLFGEVERYSKLKIRYFDLKGIEHKEEFEGFTARVIQHEYDHLNGILYTDKVDLSTLMTPMEYRKMKSGQ